MRRSMATFILTTLAATGAFGQAQWGEVREFYNGVRSLGMGGASIAVVNDETALYSNPAALGKVRDFYGTVFDPEVDGSALIPTLYKAKQFGNPFEPSSVHPTLDRSRETYYHARGQISPSLVVKNFGIGLYARYLLDAMVNEDGTEMRTYGLDDLGLFLGFNLRLWEGRIKLGVTGKAISRIEVDKTLDTTGDLSFKGNAAEGAALGADVGLILTAPWVWLPTLSAVVRDVGGTNFEAGSGLRMSATERPKKLEQDIDVAFALFPIHSGKSRSAFTVEQQRIKEAGESGDATRYLHVGYEYNYADILFLRAGMNQRYATAGFEIASEFTQVQVASYGEDVGPVGEPREDRRLVIKFSFRF